VDSETYAHAHRRYYFTCGNAFYFYLNALQHNACLSFIPHYFLSLTLALSFSEDSLVGIAVLISVFNNQIAVAVTLLYVLITGFQALKKADLLPKFPVR